MYKHMVVVLRHVWRTFWRIHSKAACHFDPSTCWMCLIKLSMRGKTNELDGKYCWTRFRFSKTAGPNTSRLAAITVLHQNVMNVLVGRVCAGWNTKKIDRFQIQTTSRNNRRWHRQNHALGFVNGHACTPLRYWSLYFKDRWVEIGRVHPLNTGILVQNCYFCRTGSFLLFGHLPKWVPVTTPFLVAVFLPIGVVTAPKCVRVRIWACKQVLICIWDPLPNNI